MKKYTPAHIANFFLWLGDKEEINISTLKLIKLVYIAYAWNLAVYNSRLFQEKIEAWKYGPVIPSIYHEFKRFRSDPIDKFAVEYNVKTNKLEYPIIDHKDTSLSILLRAVWEVYKNETGENLSQLTHEEDSPWCKAFNNGTGLNAQLDDEDIKKRAVEALRKYS